MSDRMKIKMVQALVGAVTLTLLMMVFSFTGYAQYTWMLFLPMVLFFALGADVKKLPSMIVCYICGVAWAYINGFIEGLFPEPLNHIIPSIIVIFLVLTIHEGFLIKTVFGNVPALFLGMATTFFVVFMQVDITPIHLICFYLYGIVLTMALVFVGMGVCSAIFGKERAFKAIVGEPEEKK